MEGHGNKPIIYRKVGKTFARHQSIKRLGIHLLDSFFFGSSRASTASICNRFPLQQQSPSPAITAAVASSSRTGNDPQPSFIPWTL
ncbi:hypothetical protein Nepgr_003771 [Nepenthes gracilis]|uniref:Uncharacterized protein n=1 Tax=Nepenthes gracilis TaxID=150966 RepID=A0AAD3XE78_NEPGR|nr:hypothetical protein Nepgr_003771 [Nepenthes gracilis]